MYVRDILEVFRLPAVSLLLENPREKKVAEHESREQPGKPQVAHTTCGFAACVTHARLVSPHRFSSKRETARNLGIFFAIFTPWKIVVLGNLILGVVTPPPPQPCNQLSPACLVDCDFKYD